MNGILLLNKPANITSFSAIDKIKKHFKIKKIGHAGTLDSFATGLLILGINEGTKILKYYVDLDKEYETIFHLGISTDTFDINGNQNYIHNGELPDEVDIKKILRTFVGEIEQVPPEYSALKINGIRASDRMRKGLEVNLKPRRVKIYSIDIVNYAKPFLVLKIKCSKGTYIRAIARDLGSKLGCGAYVRSLLRTKIGMFSLEDAIDLDKIMANSSIDRYVIPLIDAMPFLQKITLSLQDVDDIYKGKYIFKDLSCSSINFLGVYKNNAVAVLEISNINGKVALKPHRVLFDK